jgi:hypothetical protein
MGMTEAEWLSCTDLTPMLRFLAGRASERQMRLLACACCRRVWHLLTDDRSRQAVEVAERFADGQATLVELAEARNRALAAENGASSEVAKAAYWAASMKAAGSIWNASTAAVSEAARVAAKAALANQAAAWDAELAAGNRDHVALLRDIVGSPFQPDPALDPAWLLFDRGVVRDLAAGIYHERAFDRLPILADALEEAGCMDGGILGHCRAAGRDHARGCWVVDLVLGRR